MTQITPISTGTITVNTNLGKRANTAVIESEVKNLVTQLLNSNPNITEEQIRVEVNNYLQTIERNGTKIGKARIVALAKLPQTIQECRPKPIVTPPAIKPQKVMRTTEIPTESLIANSPIIQVETQTVPIKKEKKLIKKLEKQGLTEAVPQEVSERTQWEEQEAKKAVLEPPKSNKQNKKEVNSQYFSSKKKKLQKKQAEIQSQAEHKKQRINQPKPVQDARYCTSQGIMNTNARKAYEFVESHNMHANVHQGMAEASYQTFLEKGLIKPEKNAEESFKVFEEAGLIPKKIEKAKPHTSKPSCNRNRNHGGYYTYTPSSRTTSVHTTTPPVTASTATNGGKKEIVTEIKEVIKEVPKTNKWLIAGAVAAGGFLGWLGTTLFANGQKKVS